MPGKHVQLAFLWFILNAVGAPRLLAAEAGDVTVPFSLGTSVYSHQFAAEGKPVKDTTLKNTFQLSEFPGIGYFVTDHLRLGVNLQFTEVVREPAKPLPSRYATFAILPQINYNFWGPLTASLVPTFATRLAGEDQYGFAVQGVLTGAAPITDDLNGTLGIEVPLFLRPYVSIGITPLVGVSYLLCHGHQAREVLSQ